MPLAQMRLENTRKTGCGEIGKLVETKGKARDGKPGNENKPPISQISSPSTFLDTSPRAQP
jgi:hypothetical protein